MADAAGAAGGSAQPEGAPQSEHGHPDATLASASDADAAFRLQLPAHQAFLEAPLPTTASSGGWSQRRRIWVGHSHLQHAVLLPGDEKAAVISESEGALRVYELASGKLISEHDLQLERYGTADLLAWPAEGAESPWVLVSSTRGLEVVDALSGRVVARLVARPVQRMKWSPDGTILMVRTEAPGDLLFFRRMASSGVALQGSGPESSSSERAQRGEGVGLRQVGQLQFPDRLDAFDLSRDNRLLAAAFYPTEQTVVWDLHTGAEVLRIRSPDFIGDLAFSPDGRMLAVGGRGLLLVDLLNPDRKAFYSHLGNNIGFVTFSPSGDALVASSYDGRIRIFSYSTGSLAGSAAAGSPSGGATGRPPGPELRLTQTLSHDGTANVYDVRFTADGQGLVSVSGDQTLRVFRAASGGPRPTAENGNMPSQFRTLAEWRAAVPAVALERREPPQPSMAQGHYLPPQLSEPARPSRIRPGKYACRVSLMYKLRDCTVRKLESGHTILRFHEGNLLELEGVLYDDGPVVRYEAWLNERSGVASCRGCEQQPIYGVLRGEGNSFRGLVTFRPYYDPFQPPEPPPARVKIEEADDRLPIMLQYRGPLD